MVVEVELVVLVSGRGISSGGGFESCRSGGCKGGSSGVVVLVV